MLAFQPAGACEAVRSQLSEYLDRELGPDERAHVTLHLAACAACARVALELALVVGALHQLSALRSPSGRA
ncbi:zf-HC2 domain-containing protein [Anaeromyxobacter oryzae]|uniref:Putative zinc-finger domain-containing protein n=1 Tax=Anaeromyxobacter oryzae TaxID=2918170 RepID=A0ABM7WS17_9BACT|nr:zf-HC2 domain-containing protein [Anaeromyxobacter oryzae]BDG02241.1 hypothetical protein AMOR_12370 [Anaeromyxobacter oryzae]